MPMPFSDFFSLDYEAEPCLLVGRWLRYSEEEDLYVACRQLLATAKAHNHCRFWLLDLRQRRWYSPHFAQWFSGLLASEVVREIGSPVFVACVASETHRADIEGLATGTMLRQAAAVEFYPYFFSNEAAARDWLHYYQAHPDQKPLIRRAGNKQSG